MMVPVFVFRDGACVCVPESLDTSVQRLPCPFGIGLARKASLGLNDYSKLDKPGFFVYSSILGDIRLWVGPRIEHLLSS